MSCEEIKGDKSAAVDLRERLDNQDSALKVVVCCISCFFGLTLFKF
jgi:hypothetical protein